MTDKPITNEPEKRATGADAGSLFAQTVAEARACFADLPPNELQALIDEALADLRGTKP